LLGLAAIATGRGDDFLRAVACAAGAYVAFGLLRFVNPRALGGGDVTLAGLLGLALGWFSVAAALTGLAAGAVLAALFAVASSGALAQNWKPTRPINLIVPWAAGGSTDQVTRVTAGELEKALKEAVAQGAMHLFEEKYGDVVRVVCFGDWTCELCGGTHVTNSADVGTAVIVSETSIGSGLRRIDMVVGEAADELVRRERELLSELGRSFNAVPEQLPERIQALRAQLKEAERERERLRDQVRTARVGGGDGSGVGATVKHGRVAYITETVDASNLDELKAYADRYLEIVKSGIVTVVGGGMFVIKVSNDLTPQYDANRLKGFFGTGGGRPQLVSGKLTVAPDEAFKRLGEELS